MSDDCLPLSLDEQQRRFYGVNEDTFARILHQVLTEELSVVEIKLFWSEFQLHGSKGKEHSSEKSRGLIVRLY